MKNNNSASIRMLSRRSLQNNRMRNIVAVIAITLTSLLFTALFSLTGGAVQMAQESTMREVGGKSHAGLKAATKEQFERVTADPMIKESCYNIAIGIADNILKRQAELRYFPDEASLENMFITLEEGRLPDAENEIIVDTFIFDELGLPHALGEKIPLTFSFMGQTIEEEFVVCGWYQGDYTAHASELALSESYWTKLKGSFTDEDFINWGNEHIEDTGMGLYAVNFSFSNASHLEEKVRTVIQNAGYEPETELDYGVNWAYMGNRMESVDPFTIIILFAAIAVILITGYLIIYNIFQISVINDIKFYGLLKTIGTTKKQIRRLLTRQAVILSAIGIPVGIIIGYGVGKLSLPFILSVADYSGAKISLEFTLWIPIFSAVFCMLTVFLSCRKPGKIAGSISPIEAAKYTETGRNKRTKAVVITAMSFSIILLAIIMTAVQSFQIDSYIEQRIVGDFLIAHINTTSGAPRNGDIDVEPEYLALADAQEGIESRSEMQTRFRSFLKINDKARAQLQKLNEEDKLRHETYLNDDLDAMLQGNQTSMDGFFYGYSEELLSQLKVLAGSLDIDKFRSGDYILLTQMHGKDNIPADEHIYQPGDTVTVEYFAKDSAFYEIKNNAGETTGIRYENLAEKEYKVMAIVEIPYSMNIHRYSTNACDAILPLSELEADSSEFCECFAVSYQVAKENQAVFEAAIKEYTDRSPQMGYITKDSLRKEFENMILVIATAGIMLAAVIALIGILNFINAITTEIISRRREFAMLQSIGMTNAQLRKMLVYEGVSYVAVAGIVSFILGSILSRLILSALNNILLFFNYQFQIMPFVIMIPLLLLVAALAPLLAYQKMKQKSIVERLRENE